MHKSVDNIYIILLNSSVRNDDFKILQLNFWLKLSVLTDLVLSWKEIIFY